MGPVLSQALEQILGLAVSHLPGSKRIAELSVLLREPLYDFRKTLISLLLHLEHLVDFFGDGYGLEAQRSVMRSHTIITRYRFRKAILG